MSYQPQRCLIDAGWGISAILYACNINFYKTSYSTKKTIETSTL